MVSWQKVDPPSSVSRLQRVYPQATTAQGQSQVPFVYRIQSDFPDFAVRTGSGVLIASHLTLNP